MVTKNPQPGRSRGGVPQGMRAISMRVSDSEGLIGLLRPGARVDVQAMLDRNGSLQLRTVLQNVEVLALNSQAVSVPGIAGPVFNLTVLTDADATDLAALVDSGSHVRVALRNPLDFGTAPRRSMALAGAFQSGGASLEQTSETSNRISATGHNNPGQKASSVSAEPALEIRVQVLDASRAAMAELGSELAGSKTGDSLRVDAFPSVAAADALLKSLAAKHEVDVVSVRKYDAALGGSVSFRAGSGYCRLRVEFVPQTGPGGKVKLRVAPEIHVGNADEMETNKYQADLPANGSFLIKGILEGGDGAALEKLFPGHSWSGRALAIFVTAGTAKPASATVAQGSRGR